MGSNIYDEMRDYQQRKDVPLSQLRRALNETAFGMISFFDLKIDEFVIGIGKLPANAFGAYRIGVNHLGLKAEITIGEHHIRDCLEHGNEWDIYGTLLHELLHAWQYVHGKPSKPPYHNCEFRQKSLECGLLVDERGIQQYDPDSPFFALLERESIFFPPIPEPKRFKKKGKSTLKKWVCSCNPPQIVRVGKAEFAARCLRCNADFVMAE